MTDSILLVEDDATLRETLALNLRAVGYEVTTEGDGIAALEAARSKEPDLVLLDLMLPELDGLTVCRTLRGFSDAPIIILTARTGELDKIVGLESGADGTGRLSVKSRLQKLTIRLTETTNCVKAPVAS